MTRNHVLYITSGIALIAVALCIYLLFAIRKIGSAEPLPKEDSEKHNMPAFSYSVTTNVNSAILYSTARAPIVSYLSNQDEWTNNSFIFYSDNNSKTLSNFIGYLQQSDVINIHVILAEDPAQNTEIVYLCGINNKGQHMYPIETTTSSFYIYKSDIQYSFNSNTQLSKAPYIHASDALTQNGGQNVLLTNVSRATNNIFRADSAQTCITAYSNGMVDNINTSAYSFLISKDALLQYIIAAQNLPTSQKIVSLQFFVGIQQEIISPTVAYPARLILMIIGLDAQGDHIYINNGTNNYVLEECMPCPVCLASPGNYVQGNSPMDISNPNSVQSFTLEDPITLLKPASTLQQRH